MCRLTGLSSRAQCDSDLHCTDKYSHRPQMNAVRDWQVSRFETREDGKTFIFNFKMLD